MMLYLDTSAFVKLNVKESMSQELAIAVREAQAVATSRLAYAESRAAFARREARLSPQAYRHIVEAFVEDWDRYIAREVTARLIKEPDDLAAHRALCGYDAFHLPSPLSLREQMSSSVVFLAFDRQLTVAARREALRIHPLGA